MPFRRAAFRGASFLSPFNSHHARLCLSLPANGLTELCRRGDRNRSKRECDRPDTEIFERSLIFLEIGLIPRSSECAVPGRYEARLAPNSQVPVIPRRGTRAR